MNLEHKLLIKRNFIKLAENIKLDDLLPCLIETKVFSKEMSTKYMNVNRAEVLETTKAMVLDVPTRGPEAFENFVQSLKLAKQYSAVKVLEPDFVVPLHDLDEVELKYEETLAEHIDKVIVKKTMPSDRDCRGNRKTYPLTSQPKGYALLIVNETYDDPSDNRAAAEKDLIYWRDLFFGLGYEVRLYKNLDYKKMDETITSFSKLEEHKDVHSSIVAISSHGIKEGILCTDSACYPRKLLLEKFNNLNCEYLKGKPKMFFIQACRGSFSDDGVPVDDVMDSKAAKELTPLHIPTYTDMLVVYSTIEDFAAYRNLRCGSWFVQIITSVFMKKAYNTDVDEMLKEVQRIMRTRKTSDGAKQMCEVVCRGWDKCLYFDP